MTPDFFTQLEAELGSLTQAGMHLETGHGRRRVILLIRRAVTIVSLALALAASLDSEFPSTATGAGLAAHVWVVPGQ